MRKSTSAILGLVLLTSLSGLGMAQVGTSTMQGQRAVSKGSSVDVTVVDAKGQPVRPESLPKDAQAKLAQVRKAAESLAASPDGGGGAQAVSISVRCTWEPLKCTITISW